MILDTNAISALLAGDERIAGILDSERRHHLPVIAIGEYRYGLARSKHRVRIQQLLNLLIEGSIVLAVDDETTTHYAIVREALRVRGRPIPENDVWIAALAVQHGLPVVTRDTHFDEVVSLRRIEW
ncbi:MAG: type II toxin-antitoxin system VapC family toxin [Acidobacteriota bacterium]